VVIKTVEETLNALLDAEADELCGAKRYEHSPTFKAGIRTGAHLHWHELKILFHGGDHGEPCATVMLPDED
jgi:hypothetical protein